MLPEEGYVYYSTRYADVLLRHEFSSRFRDLAEALHDFRISWSEIEASGGNETPFVRRFVDSLAMRGWWTEQRKKSYKIDLLTPEVPGIALDVEWNSKDQTFKRDLPEYRLLHEENVIAVGVIVTRGPELQDQLKGSFRKYGASTTHWSKLLSAMDLAGTCPMMAIGIESDRIEDGPVQHDPYPSLFDSLES